MAPQAHDKRHRGRKGVASRTDLSVEEWLAASARHRRRKSLRPTFDVMSATCSPPTRSFVP